MNFHLLRWFVLSLAGQLWYDKGVLEIGTIRKKKRRETDMSIIVNIYYTGTGGNARKFAQEMENSGVAQRIRQEEGNLRYE